MKVHLDIKLHYPMQGYNEATHDQLRNVALLEVVLLSAAWIQLEGSLDAFVIN